MGRIGEFLVAEGLVSEDAVNRALGFQRVSGERLKLGTILLNRDLIAEDALLANLAKFHRCPAVDWRTLSAASIAAVRLLPAARAIRLAAVPYALERSVVRVAFGNPADLSAIDEVAAITGKRVVPGVTTEVRLLQALQKYYGRRIPGEFRTIVLKLDRKTTETQRVKEKALPSFDVEAPQSSWAGADLSRSSPAFPAAIQTPPSNHGPSRSPQTLPSPIEIGSLSQLPAQGATRTAKPAVSARQTNPTAVPRSDSPPPPLPMGGDPIPGNDSLTKWVDDALTAFQVRGVGGFAPPRAAPPPSLPAAFERVMASGPPPAPAPEPVEEAVSGMWQASPLEDIDEVASSMWTPDKDQQAEIRLWEARSREEIGQAVLESALTDLPRVILFSAGKTTITGWSGRGPNLTPEDVASLRISISEPSVFAAVQKSGAPHFGPVDRGKWPRALSGLLGADPPDCAIFPIQILDGVAAFLYADRLGSPMDYQDFASIARASASTANVLTRFLLRPNTAPVG